MGLDTNSHAEGLIGACVSLFFAGGFVGAASTWYIADRWGRKIAISLGCIIVLFGGALTAGAVNIAMLLVSGS
jgi:MFS family permease